MDIFPHKERRHRLAPLAPKTFSTTTGTQRFNPCLRSAINLHSLLTRSSAPHDLQCATTLKRKWLEAFAQKRRAGNTSRWTDVLKCGRLCMRLRLGFIDQVFEGGGSVTVRASSQPRPCVQKRRSGRLLASRHRRPEPSPLLAAFLGRQNEQPQDNLHFLLVHHCAELVQLRVRQCRQPRLHGVDGHVVTEALDHPHQNTTLSPTR